MGLICHIVATKPQYRAAQLDNAYCAAPLTALLFDCLYLSRHHLTSFFKAQQPANTFSKDCVPVKSILKVKEDPWYRQMINRAESMGMEIR